MAKKSQAVVATENKLGSAFERLAQARRTYGVMVLLQPEYVARAFNVQLPKVDGAQGALIEDYGFCQMYRDRRGMIEFRCVPAQMHRMVEAIHAWIKTDADMRHLNAMTTTMCVRSFGVESLALEEFDHAVWKAAGVAFDGHGMPIIRNP